MGLKPENSCGHDHDNLDLEYQNNKNIHIFLIKFDVSTKKFPRMIF